MVIESNQIWSNGVVIVPMNDIKKIKEFNSENLILAMFFDYEIDHKKHIVLCGKDAVAFKESYSNYKGVVK